MYHPQPDKEDMKASFDVGSSMMLAVVNGALKKIEDKEFMKIEVVRSAKFTTQMLKEQMSFSSLQDLYKVVHPDQGKPIDNQETSEEPNPREGKNSLAQTIKMKKLPMNF